ncbi:cupredoxin domain-containing protein [Patescibacteria group bacterium]|nr:cupredoxin domain-containing protein [Patescibacteria group bacterium]
MKKIILFIIVILILGWAMQSFTDLKVFNYAKNFFSQLKVSGLGIFQPAIPPADMQLNIFIRDSKFLPNMNAVKTGANVTWYNEDNKTHNVAGDDWSSGDLAPGRAFSKKFNTAGRYKYHCSIHPEMTGEIIVY